MATRANRTQLPLASRNGASAPERVFWKQGRGQAAEIRTVGAKLTTRGPRAGADGSTARPEVPRQVPLSVAIPVFEAASPEEEDHLQDVWAALLVNAADASGGVEIKRAFVRILQDLSAMEVRLLQAFCDAPGETTGVFWTRSLPNHYAGPNKDPEDPRPPKMPVQIGLRQLLRPGCVSEAGTWVSLAGIRGVRITALGRALVEASSPAPIRNVEEVVTLPTRCITLAVFLLDSHYDDVHFPCEPSERYAA